MASGRSLTEEQNKTAAAWGLTAAPIIRTRDRSETIISFIMAGAAPEGSIPFPFKAQVTIKQYQTWTGSPTSGFSNLLWQKICYQTTQRGRVDGSSQGITLNFADTIWLLKNTVFQQLWTVNTTGGSSTAPESRIILFLDIASYIYTPWSIMSVQWEINEIITYAAGCGISIAAGTIDYSGWYINYIHVKAISCWDALLKCLEPIADAKAWIDDSSGTPTLNVRTRANIAAMSAPTGTAAGPVTLPYKGTDSAGRKHFNTDLTPRYDLVPPCVSLQYQTLNTVDGKAAPTWTSDTYPAVSSQQPFAFVAPIDLTGASAVTMTGQLDCEALACVGGSQATKRAWWASKRGGEQGKLADFRVRFQNAAGAAVTIGDATVTDDTGAAINLSNYPNRIVQGSYHAWMKNGSTQINCIRAKIKVQVTVAQYDVQAATPAETDTNGNVIKKSLTETFECNVTLTNSPAGVTTYNGLYFNQTAEVPATNLAQNIYTSRATLDYDGAHEIVDPGLPNGSTPTPPLAQIIGHWNVLNLSGGASAWASANMTIAGTEIDLMTNHQRIDIGPSKHLSPQDWNELLQFFRSRQVFIFAGGRATGYGDQNAVVDMAHNTPDANTVPGLSVDSMSVLMGADPLNSGKSIKFNSDATAGQIIVIQQDTSTNTVYTTGIIAPEYSGSGAPASSTLPASTYYRVGDRYVDTSVTPNNSYRCSTGGSNSSSVWSQIGSGGGGNVWL